MKKESQKQEIKCLFGHHEFIEKGCIRQCEHCGVAQLYNFKGNNWRDIGWVDWDIRDFGEKGKLTYDYTFKAPKPLEIVKVKDSNRPIWTSTRQNTQWLPTGYIAGVTS